jgi:antitoxin ParD1/3/4
MSFALPESLREYIDERVRTGDYGNTSEYLRDLIRRDQAEEAKRLFRDLIEAGVASGVGRTFTPDVVDELRSQVTNRQR